MATKSKHALGTVRAKRPKLVALDAPQAKREEFYKAVLRWLPKYERVLRAHGCDNEKVDRIIRQQKSFAEIVAMTDAQREADLRASTERVRNLLGRDFVIDWSGLESGGRDDD